MFRVIAWQNYALAAGLALTAAAGWGEWRHQQGQAEGRAAVVAELRAAAEETRERIRDADVGTGDHDDDLRWLADRLRRPPAGGNTGP